MVKLDRLIRIFGLKVAKIAAVPESHSSEVHCLVLDSGVRVILKIPFTKEKLIREYQILQLLADKLPVPKVLGLWEGDESTPPAMLLSCIEGQPATGPIDAELACQMGELLARLHQIPMKDYSLVEGETISWWKSLWIYFYDKAEDCEQVLPAHFIEACYNTFEKHYKGLPAADGPCMVHLDYRPGNILIHNNKIMGLIDFESARGGSSNIDFITVKQLVWDKYPGTKEAFLRGYTSVRPAPDVDRTMPFYTFYNAFSRITWCIKRGDTSSNFFCENLKTLKQMNAEA